MRSWSLHIKPEVPQRGKPAFGVVVYETVTGEMLFHGEDLRETLASVASSVAAGDRAGTV